MKKWIVIVKNGTEQENFGFPSEKARDEFVAELKQHHPKREWASSLEPVDILDIQIDYPIKAQFQTDVELPSFQYGCKKRTALLRDFLKDKSFDTPQDIGQFIVEKVEKTPNGEFWIIGS